MSADIDCVVVGAGVIGLAIARELALTGRDVLVIEAEGQIGTATSSRNSEVIHAGLYYPKESAKAQLCVSGREALYYYCDAYGVPYKKTGKLIVATHHAQLEALQALYRKALANGVTDIQHLSAQEAMALEPELKCEAALLSPSTGIIDSHALMLSLQGQAEQAGSQFVFRTPLNKAEYTDSIFHLKFGGADPMSLTARCVVNAAGLAAPHIASLFPWHAESPRPVAYYCKGHYFALAGRSPFSHLIYPMPDEAGLGVHLTLDMGGQARFGPDTEWVESINYDIDPTRVERFYQAVRQYWPNLSDDSLAPAYTGIRPKIVGPSEPPADFLIAGPSWHGVPGLVHLLGIESPGLTACLAIAQRCRLALEHLD
ncbi:MAG: FAD-dependent oxidoreductase [Pusillimonas sp.]|jgi:L-2-hydroxyglutarate oxidase LhgO|nr:FAD-dependent oxidoreductase [Pusillimonas sp.]